jgi:Undecaprenyl-phosphate galactose phosphotransferase WbaP
MRVKAVATSQRSLIQPIVSTEAISGLVSLVPGVGNADRSELTCPLPSRTSSRSRIRHVVLTSIPLIFADLLALSACFLVAALVSSSLLGTGITLGVLNNLIAVGVIHLLVGSFLGLFPASGHSPVLELRNQLSSIGVSFVLLLTLNGLVGAVTRVELLTILLAAIPVILAAPVARFSVRRICAPMKWWGEPAIIIGAGPQGVAVFEFLAKMPQRGLKPLGIIDDRPDAYWAGNHTDSSIDYLGTTSDLVSICRKRHCHWAIAAVADRSPAEMRQILNCGSLIPNLIVLHTNVMIPTLWTQSFEAAGLAGVHIRDRLLFPFQRWTKRVVDMCLSLLLLVVFSPLMVMIALMIRWYSPGPVLFRHEGRIGRHGKYFGALKIRTMVLDSERVLSEYLAANPEAREEWKRDQKLKADPRVIPGIGRFLRRSSLDELPQLWNVFVGDMSLVGPRPIYADNEIEKFQELYPLYLRVRPGLTGLWQISGRNNTTYEDRVRFDTYYVRNWSLWLDYFILLRTVRTVLMREGSY